jgi:hypothetical protein
MQCWQRRESTTTLVITSNLEQRVENISVYVHCQSQILEIRTLFDQCRLEMDSNCNCFHMFMQNVK